MSDPQFIGGLLALYAGAILVVVVVEKTKAKRRERRGKHRW